jgi:hypothetical protein
MDSFGKPSANDRHQRAAPFAASFSHGSNL